MWKTASFFASYLLFPLPFNPGYYCSSKVLSKLPKQYIYNLKWLCTDILLTVKKRRKSLSVSIHSRSCVPALQEAIMTPFYLGSIMLNPEECSNLSSIPRVNSRNDNMSMSSNSCQCCSVTTRRLKQDPAITFNIKKRTFTLNFHNEKYTHNRMFCKCNQINTRNFTNISILHWLT